MNNSTYYLKVLKGLHIDTVISVKSSRLTIGGGDSDIILSDLSPDSKYLEIVFRKNKIYIKKFGAPVLLNGKELPTPSEYVSYDLHQLIDFGLSSISISSSENDWGNIPSTLALNKGSKIALDADYSLKKLRKLTLTNYKIIMLGVFAVLAITMSIVTSKKPSSLDPASPFISISSKVRVLLNKNGFDKVKIQALGSNRIHLVGTILDNQSKIKLEGLVSSITKRYTSKLIIQKDMLSEAMEILHTFNINNIEFTLDRQNLIAKGYTNGDWQSAKLSILEDISGVTSVVDIHVDSIEKRLNRFKNILADKGLDAKISLLTKNGMLISSGELVGYEMKVWHQTKKTFIESYTTTESFITDNVTNYSDKIKLLIQSVNIGRTKYFVAQNGFKYMVGSNLGNDYVVSAIELNRVMLLNKNNIEIPIYFLKSEGLSDGFLMGSNGCVFC